MAALIVHRPSPESETRPANADNVGSVSSAPAVRSSSHEAITLPRRQTSATSRRLKSYWYSSGLRSGVGDHDAVLDAVVDHLHEMAGTGRAAMQIAALGRAADLLASGKPRRGVSAGRQRGEDRIEVLDDRLVAADHEAISALQPPHPP